RELGLDVFLATHPGGAALPASNCNDNGAGSLRDAIASAGNGDVIDATGLACGTISLSTGATAIGVDDLTIDGPGAAALTVGNGAKYGARVPPHRQRRAQPHRHDGEQRRGRANRDRR